MEDRKIQVMPSNGHSRKQRYLEDEPDIWSKLLHDDDFKNINSAKVWRLLSVALAEVCGTAVLVGLGCSSLLTTIPGTEGSATHLNIILTFGFAVSVVVTIFGHISGSHVNPAVSVAGVIFGQISIPKFILYVICQCVGATIGIAAIKMITPGSCMPNGFCVTLPHAEVGDVKAMLAEAFMTGILVWVVNAAWDRRCQDKHDSMPLKFGIAVAAIALPGGKFSGASLNPARSFGPALMSGNWESHWVYWVGPIGGSIVASAIYRTFFSEAHPPQPVNNRASEPEEEHPL